VVIGEHGKAALGPKKMMKLYQIINLFFLCGDLLILDMVLIPEESRPESRFYEVDNMFSSA